MKTLNDYMAMSYRMEIVEDKDEGGFVVSYPDLPGCITCGDTLESAVANALDAKKAWIEAALEDGVKHFLLVIKLGVGRCRRLNVQNVARFLWLMSLAMLIL